MSTQLETTFAAPTPQSAGEDVTGLTAGSFRPLRAPDRLCIPLSGIAKEGDIIAKPAGTFVRRGECLVQQYPDSATAPLSP
ncbi:MAG TPA: hypothetical protein VFC46_06290, partial [Humisphaera sp.]|nr:hypothetical protein [Humisphaera sp.]